MVVVSTWQISDAEHSASSAPAAYSVALSEILRISSTPLTAALRSEHRVPTTTISTIAAKFTRASIDEWNCKFARNPTLDGLEAIPTQTALPRGTSREPPAPRGGAAPAAAAAKCDPNQNLPGIVGGNHGATLV
ncbi:unnamed protein product [Linum trigynum]|uniref:Uncharacterized protein n=1 Tax=Linum trigynum TaxID=586398 RepID=A0AAV2DRY6_9ROSI